MARIEYGKSSSGQIVRVADARRGVRYTCPTCGQPLELRRGDQLEYFAHWRNLTGTRQCELFSPSDGGSGPDDTSRRQATGVDDDPSELGLLLTQAEGRWGLGLRLPEIPSDELGEASLRELRSAYVDVYAGNDRLVRVSALDLRPGVGAACVDAVPTVQAFRTRPLGSWPASVNRERWLLEGRGLNSRGALFRLRRGEWMRLVTGSGVHFGETLLVLADARSAPPGPIVREAYSPVSSGALHWRVWEVQLPTGPIPSVLAWLNGLGHAFVPRPWRLKLATPARAHNERGEPVFWLGDSPVLLLEAPQSGATALVVFQNGTTVHRASVQATEKRDAQVRVSAREAGLSRLAIAGERLASLDLSFIRPPQSTAIADLLAQAARLRIQVGEHQFEAWQLPAHRIRVPAPEHRQVQVELGDETARARVTVWERGKQRSKRGLDARGVARELEVSLESAKRIEVDAGNFGRVVLLPVRPTVDPSEAKNVGDRLAWRDHAVSMWSRAEDRPTAAILEQPRAPGSLLVRPVAPSTLARARLALRRRLEAGESGK